MGASTALLLARRGVSVEIFDSEREPFFGASRWNEGKIHLGFLYNADPSLSTAPEVIAGGLHFRPLAEDLLSCSLESVTTAVDDIFLCHRGSVVPPDDMEAYFARVVDLVRQHPDSGSYLVDASACGFQRLAPRQLGAITDSSDIVAGFQVPERSVSTVWIADRFVGALRAESNVVPHRDTRVVAVHPESQGDFGGAWYVDSSSGRLGPYDCVVNALWHGRLAVDLTAGVPPPSVWSNRYRQSLFVRTRVAIGAPSVVVATGPFGDIKNYNDRDFYLSWYPEGLRIDSSAVEPPYPPLLEELALQQKCAAIFDRLEALIPAVEDIRRNVESVTLEGGWVFAAGRGALSDPTSTLHRRSDFGVFRHGNYISVDTGKYSTAPWLAQRLADHIA